MPSDLTRRTVGLALIAAAVSPTLAVAQTAKIWSSDSAYNALRQDRVRMIDVRSRPEWADTGIAEGAWPISMHEDRFPERLFSARAMAEGRPVALICATGGRSGGVMRSLQQAGYSDFVDVCRRARLDCSRPSGCQHGSCPGGPSGRLGLTCAS